MEIMTQYYFLATVLPALQIGLPPEIDFYEFHTLLKDNLTAADYRKVRRLLWLYDLYNIRAFWTGEPLDRWGTLDKNELEEALIIPNGPLPKFIFSYLQEHENQEERLQHFPSLFVKFFEEMARTTEGFERKYALFERNLRLSLVAFRAKQLGRSLEREFQYEDPDDEVIAQLLAQKDAPAFEPPAGFEDLKPILEKYYSSPMELQKAMYEYRFNKLEEFVGLSAFSIDRILLYLVEYIMVDKWIQLDRKKGIEIVDTIVKEVT